MLSFGSAFEEVEMERTTDISYTKKKVYNVQRIKDFLVSWKWRIIIWKLKECNIY